MTTRMDHRNLRIESLRVSHQIARADLTEPLRRQARLVERLRDEWLR